MIVKCVCGLFGRIVSLRVCSDTWPPWVVLQATLQRRIFSPLLPSPPTSGWGVAPAALGGAGMEKQVGSVSLCPKSWECAPKGAHTELGVTSQAL